MRRSLAFSIHELSQILGEDNTRVDLVPIFNNFLKDLDEVSYKLDGFIVFLFRLSNASSFTCFGRKGESQNDLNVNK